MRRVLHLKMVTQCAMLEDFGVFLVLADGSLFAYHIEALVPSSRQSLMTLHAPQKLNSSKDMLFFRVGNVGGRTLVGYRRKQPKAVSNPLSSQVTYTVDSVDVKSIFCFLEPDAGAIQDTNEMAPGGEKSKWFKVYKVDLSILNHWHGADWSI